MKSTMRSSHPPSPFAALAAAPALTALIFAPLSNVHADICLEGDTAQRIRVRDEAVTPTDGSTSRILRHVERCYRPTPTSLRCVNLIPGNRILARTTVDRLDQQATFDTVFDHMMPAITGAIPVTTMVIGAATNPALAAVGIGQAIYLGGWTLLHYNEQGSPLYRRLVHDYYPNRAISLITHSVPGVCRGGTGPWGRWSPTNPFMRSTPSLVSSHELDLLSHEFTDGMRRLLYAD